MVVADLDMALITKRKRMMDSVGHARPELLSLAINERPAHLLRHARPDATHPGASACYYTSTAALSLSSRELMTELNLAAPARPECGRRQRRGGAGHPITRR
jgi:hypothetical protein